MPKITISQTNERILVAMADERGTTADDVLDQILGDIRINRAGIMPDDTPEETEARLKKLERKAAKAKAEREAQPASGE